MSKGFMVLADTRRYEHYKSLLEMPDRDMCEMIRAHFESHPALPGEAQFRDTVNSILNVTELTDEQKAELAKDGFEPAHDTPFDKDGFLSTEEKQSFAAQYAKTRIRETPLKERISGLDFNDLNKEHLKSVPQNGAVRDPFAKVPQDLGPIVDIYKVDAELQRMPSGGVMVCAKHPDATGYTMIGTLPDNFLTNNPMNVESCSAEIQLEDYSNGQMKNVSMHVIADTDLMSGDVVDLDENLLSGLEQNNNMEQ